jgi:hypothetical protein
MRRQKNPWNEKSNCGLKDDRRVHGDPVRLGVWEKKRKSQSPE